MESKVATGACSAYEEKPEFGYSGSNAISLYLKTLRAIPPLREGEEPELAEAITAGREAATKLDAVARERCPAFPPWKKGTYKRQWPTAVLRSSA